MKRVTAILGIAIAALFHAGITQAEDSKPRFADYPAIGTYQGRNAPIVLGRDDMRFRTRLRGEADRKPDFAGHYIVAAWGCGAECLMGALIDANTGRVYWFPHTICCWPPDVDDQFRPIVYRLESRLIVFTGMRNEANGDQGTHYYEFEDGKFVHIRSLR